MVKITSFLKIVRVAHKTSPRRKVKSSIDLLFGPISKLIFDLDSYLWTRREELMTYSTKLGQKVLQINSLFSNVMVKKWNIILGHKFLLDCNDIQSQPWAHKEAVFI